MRPLSQRREGTEQHPVDQPAAEATAPPQPSAPLRVALAVAVTLCLVVSLVHVLLVFLHVSPSNEVSRRYSSQIEAWVYPLFEQNWRLFAPDPESANRQISARTRQTSADGAVTTSDWFDLTAVDLRAIEHNPLPSHTAQNMLRRAWIGYLETHGADDLSRTERALMMQQYLRNIAVARLAAYRPGTFDAIQLRGITQPIGRPAAAGEPRTQPPAETRELPWWTVASDGS